MYLIFMNEISSFLYADEETERTEQHIPNDAETIYTRHMFLDLLHTDPY